MPKTDEQILQEITKRIEDKENLRFWNGVRRIVLGSVYFASIGCASIGAIGAGSYFLVVLLFLVICFFIGANIFPYVYGTLTYSVQSFWSHKVGWYFLPGIILLNIPIGVLVAFALFFYTSVTAAIVLILSMATLFICLVIRLFSTSWEWENNVSSIYRLRFPFY